MQGPQEDRDIDQVAATEVRSRVFDELVVLSTYVLSEQTRIKALLARPEDAYHERNRLWVELEAVITTKVDPAITEVPAATERTIATLEKDAKNLAAKDNDWADKLCGVLANLKFM